MKRTYRLLAAILAALMLMTTGCSSTVSTDKYSSTVAATYGDKVTYLDEANFWLRYYQWMYEGYYGYYYSLFGYSDMWVLESGQRTQTNAQTMKEQVMAEILQSYILSEHAAEYGVTVTAEDEEKIDAFIKTMHETFNAQFFTFSATITDEQIHAFLKKRTEAVKVWDAVKQAAEVSVSDEECATFTVNYFLAKEASGSSSTETTAASETAAETLSGEALADAILAALQAGTTEEDAAKTYSDATHSSVSYMRTAQSTTALFTTGKDMKTGDIQKVYVEGTGWYVIICAAELDEKATAENRADLEDSAREKKFSEVYVTWTPNAKKFTVTKAYEALTLTPSYVAQTTTAAS